MFNNIIKIIIITIILTTIPITIVSADTYDYTYEGCDNPFTINDVIKQYNNFPQEVRDCNKSSIMLLGDYDSYWGDEVYGLYYSDNRIGVCPTKDLDGKSYAYKMNFLRHVLLHEIGHSFLESKREKHYRVWEVVIELSDKNIDRRLYEDFAESFRSYFQNRKRFELEYPIKFYAMKKLIKERFDNE